MKTSVRIVGLWAEIQIWDFLDTNKRYKPISHDILDERAGNQI
jgi:hypothetical protein